MSETRHCPKCNAPLPSIAPEGICPKCLLNAGFRSEPLSARFTPPEPADLAADFPDLDVLELLGKGGMGAVYKARQKQLDRFVAIKILPPEVSDDPAFEVRFTREARTLARLNHPNIVQVYDFGQAGRYFYFLMEFVDGQNLRDVIEAGGLEPKQALAIIPDICAALQFAHDTSVVHRDIKPENILIDRQGRVKIADFGLAMLLDREPADITLTEAGQVMGTPHYMAPEQMRGSHSIDHRADIYSLGVVFYELLTGELPVGHFEAPSRRLQVDVRLDEVVLRALATEPDRRYQHASDVQHDIEQISASVPVPASSLDEARQAGREEHRSAYRIPLLIGGNIWLLAAIILLLGKNVARTQPLMYSFFGFGAWLYPSTYHLLVAFCGGLSIICFALSWRGRPGHSLKEQSESSQIRSSEESSTAEAPTLLVTADPRVSRKAVIGAIWASAFFIAAVLLLAVERTVVSPSTGSNFRTIVTSDGTETVATESSPRGSTSRQHRVSAPARSWWQWLLAFTVLPAGLTAPLGTTGLGMAAISSIRASRGHIIGLPLAVADALLFPLLILDVLLAATLATVVPTIFERGLNVAAIVLVSLLLSVIVDVLIARAVWHRVRVPI